MKLTRIDFFAALFAGGVLFGWNHWNETAKESEPAENWFIVRNIAIPDFVEGENPIIIYDREQRREASIRRNVDVHHAGNLSGDPVCSGRNVRTSGPASNLADVNILFADFVSAPCSPAEGSYVAQTSWIISPEGYRPKRMTYTSNVFRVFPKGTVPFTEKEQEQLEQARDLLLNPTPLIETPAQ